MILRSKNIYGPYEEKNVLHQGNSIVNGPHQGALVDTVNGDEWFLHFQDRGLYGRIVHMQPVVWENDWPVMGINAVDGCGEPCIIHKNQIPESQRNLVTLRREMTFHRKNSACSGSGLAIRRMIFIL